MMRLGQRFVISTPISFNPVFRSDVTSTVNGGFQRMSGNFCPLRVTWANSRTRPRSSTTLEPDRFHPSGKLNCFTYVAVPEKYLTPGSVAVVHEDKEPSSIWAGAPRLGGNATFHAPVMVNRSSATGTDSFPLSALPSRKTTKTDSSGLRWSTT